ncbi:MAG TPA: FtsX-like permease family protein [Ktedonobacterales bacterium]|nr:FtsX-like permease family protein [Ktedonobacterales bacterium]
MLSKLTSRLTVKRAWHRRVVVAPVLLGVLATIIVLAGVPLFAAATTEVSLQSTLHAPAASSSRSLKIFFSPPSVLDATGYQHFNHIFTSSARSTLGSDLLQQAPVRSGQTAPLHLYPAGSAHTSQHLLDTATLWFSSEMNTTHLHLSDGRFPSPRLLDTEHTQQQTVYDVEAMVSPDWATQFQLHLNDVLEVTVPIKANPNNNQPISPEAQEEQENFLRVHIVGFFQPKSLQDPAWFGDLDPFTPPISAVLEPLPPAPIWLNEGAFLSALTDIGLQGIDLSYIWAFPLNVDSITASNAAVTHANIIQLKEDSIADVITSLDSTLQDFLQRLAFVEIFVLVALLPGLALLFVYLGITALALMEQSHEEFTLMKSRGASPWQILSLTLKEGLLLCGSAFLAGPLLTWLLITLLAGTGYFAGFASFVGLSLLLSLPQAYGYAFAGTGICFLILLLSAIASTRSSLLTAKISLSRPRRRSLFLRFAPGALLVALGAYGTIQIQQSDTFFTTNLKGALTIDWNAAAAPTLLLLGMAGLSLLLLPPLLGWLDRLGQRLSGVSFALAVRQMVRRPAPYSRLVFLLSLTVSVGLFAAIFSGTLNGSLDDRAAYQTGADLRLVEGDKGVPDYERQAAPLTDQLRALPGAQSGFSAFRTTSALSSTTLNAPQSTILAVDSAHVAQVAYWRSDFADQPLETLMGLLQHARVQSNTIPAIVSDQLLAQVRGKVGGEVGFPIGSGFVATFTIVGTYHFFPTLDPGLSLVCDLHQLAAQSTGAGSTNQIAPTEVWLKLAPDAPVYTTALVQQHLLYNAQHKQIIVGIIQTDDRAALATSYRKDPLDTLFIGALSLDFIIAGLLCTAGLILLFYLLARQRAFEFAVLRSMGLSLRQLTRSLGWEQLTLLGVALLLGIPLGIVIALLSLPVFTIDTTGTPQLLPVIPQLSVPSALQQSVFLLVCLGIALACTLAIFRRLRVQEALRLGEE